MTAPPPIRSGGAQPAIIPVSCLDQEDAVVVVPSSTMIFVLPGYHNLFAGLSVSFPSEVSEAETFQQSHLIVSYRT